MEPGYWLLDWINAQDVKSTLDARRVVRSPAALVDLRNRVESVTYNLKPLQTRNSSETLVAGRGIDLSGALECSHFDCKREQVDRLFSRVWHYFDRIVVVCVSAHELKHADFADEKVRERLEHNVRLLLYLREIGAEEMLLFREKPPACRIHAYEQLSDVGMPTDETVVNPLAEALLHEGELTGVRPHDDHLHYSFHHPTFVHSAFGVLRNPPKSDLLPEAIARDVVQTYVSSLAMDVTVAKLLAGPLGSDLGYYNILLKTFSKNVTQEDVAFALHLPVLENVSPRDLLKLRRNEGGAFERFRVALRTAIRERVATVGGSDASQIAGEIERDLLRPALAEIDEKLVAAKGVLARKAAVGLAVGVLATTCGLVLGVPILTGVGAATAASLLQAEYKFTEERRDIRFSDMYFLWKAHHAH
jgi:hypothetical protein